MHYVEPECVGLCVGSSGVVSCRLRMFERCVSATRLGSDDVTVMNPLDDVALFAFSCTDETAGIDVERRDSEFQCFCIISLFGVCFDSLRAAGKRT